MTNTLKTFYEFTYHSLDPRKLSSRLLSATDFENWRTFMMREDADLRRKMIDYLLSTVTHQEKNTWLSSVQKQLVFSSDLLNSFLFRKKQLWKSHPAADDIRKHYLYSISAIEETLEFAHKTFPEYYDLNLKFTDFQLRQVLPGLRKVLFDIRKLLANAGISAKLSQIVSCGLLAVIDSQPSKNDFHYINHLYECMLSVEDLNDHFLKRLLLQLDFNQPEFFLYQVEVLDEKLFEVNGLHEQRELLCQEKLALTSLKREARYKLHPLQSPLILDLGQYFQEREEAVEALLAIRRAAARDRVSPDQAFRILMDMTVPQLALFFRMQMEVGLMLKGQISEVFNFVAQHFYTEKAHFISSTNMLKLSTTIEFNTVLKVYDMLLIMIKWLDNQFGVSQYSR